MGSGEARIFIPQREGFSPSMFAYVAFCWVHAFAQYELQLEDSLPEIPPAGFEELKQEMLAVTAVSQNDAAAKIGLYLVYTSNRNWAPQELYDRIQVSFIINSSLYQYFYSEF
jgi:hypothetical protein